jgi:energy-converting hydrogenase A subunit M
MIREEIINILRKEVDNYDYGLFHSDLEQADKEILQKKIDALDKAIEALEQQDRITQILDDCDLEAWEILEKIKEAVRA